MNALYWFYAAAAGWGLAAVILFAGGTAKMAMRAACLVSGLAGAAAVAGGVSSLLWGNSGVVSFGAAVAVGTAQVQASSLAGVFAALLGLIAVAIAAYAPATTSQVRARRSAWPATTSRWSPAWRCSPPRTW